MLRLVAAHAIGDLILGYFLISHFGARGAVALVLLDKMVGLLAHYLIVSKLVTRVAIARVVWRPIVAGGCLAACLALVQAEGIVLSVVVGGLVYLGALLAVTVWSLGGRGWRTGYARLLAE